MVTTVIDESRRPWWRRESSGDVPELPAQDAAMAVDDRLVIRSALADLPPRQRAVIVLRYFEDLNIAATAEVLGCTTGTVSSQTAKALTTLRKNLAGTAVAGLLPEEES